MTDSEIPGYICVSPPYVISGGEDGGVIGRCWDEDSEWRSALAVFRLQLERLSPERRSSSLQDFADIAEPFVVEVHAPATAGAGDLLLVKKPSKAFLDLLAAMGAVDNEHA